jgi:CRISPR/Cas system CSM-associated protein Csm3 (group 7 of RAMP superfamily)
MRDGKPELRGEAIKAAIREAAERILRWRKFEFAKEESARSVPDHPAVARLFAPQWARTPSPARYWFHSSVAESGTPFETTSTSIDSQSGVAQEATLRSFELWREGIEFKVEITATGSDWTVGTKDREDLWLLLMAVMAVDSIGGAWGTGRGELELVDLKVSDESLNINWTDLQDPALAVWLGERHA